MKTDKTRSLGLHNIKLPSAALPSNKGQPPSKNPQPTPQAPKRLSATQSPPSQTQPANKTAQFSPRLR